MSKVIVTFHPTNTYPYCLSFKVKVKERRSEGKRWKIGSREEELDEEGKNDRRGDE